WDTHWPGVLGASIPNSLLHEAGFVKQLVPLEYPFLIPGDSIITKGHSQSAVPCRHASIGPCEKGRTYDLVDDGGLAVPPILPRQEGIPASPPRARSQQGFLAVVGDASKREVADRHDVKIAVLHRLVTPAVAERVKLFHISEPQRRLLGDPFPQARLQRP